MQQVRIRGAREHGPKNIDVDLPRDSLVAMPRLSGSGKSPLAFDTICAEDRCCCVEGLSAEARQLLEAMQKSEVESLPLQVGRADDAIAPQALMSADPRQCGPDR